MGQVYRGCEPASPGDRDDDPGADQDEAAGGRPDQQADVFLPGEGAPGQPRHAGGQYHHHREDSAHDCSGTHIRRVSISTAGYSQQRERFDLADYG